MTNAEMVNAIRNDNITEELINALIDFKWETDTYGFLNEYGHIDDEGVREQAREEVIYMLDNDRDTLILDIEGEE